MQPDDRFCFPWAALLLALFAVLVWGVSFAVTRLAVQEIPPMALALLRFALASLFLWPWAARATKRVTVAAADRLPILGLGLSGVTFYFAFENFGLRHTTASHAALIVAVIPLGTELVAAARQRRRPSSRVLAGLLLALAGVLVIFGESEGEASLFGDLLMTGAVASWVVYTFLAERLIGRYPNLFLTQRIMVTGTLTLLPLALVEVAWLPLALPSAGAWAGVVFLGIFCSALAYLAWNRAIPALGVTTVNSLLYGIPLVGVLSGVLALGEPLTLQVGLGVLLIPGGVILAGWRSGGGNDRGISTQRRRDAEEDL